MKFIYYILIISFSAVLSQPSVQGISGSTSHKGILTIEGSGFGSKSNASPVKYDDFELGSAGKSLAGGDWLISTNKGFDPVYSNKIVRTNSALSAQSHTQDAPSGDNYQYRCAFGIGDQDGIREIYINFWWYYDGPSNSPGCVKFVRLYPNPTSPYSGPPNTYIDFDCDPYSGLLNSDDITSLDGHNSRWIGDAWDWTRARGHWQHVQFYFKASDVGQENGTAKMWVGNGDAPIRQVLNEEDNLLTRTPANPALWHSFWIGNYLSILGSEGCNGHNCQEPNEVVSIFYDNVYIDYTQARIEVGDNPVYSDCMHTEIQVPSAWDDNSVTIQLNQGSFSSGGTVYLYVVDSAGLVNSNGFPIVLNTSSTTKPEAPKGLEILKEN